jgi:phenylalanyl-tRNA synthetase alpha chain
MSHFSLLIVMKMTLSSFFSHHFNEAIIHYLLISYNNLVFFMASFFISPHPFVKRAFLAFIMAEKLLNQLDEKGYIEDSITLAHTWQVEHQHVVGLIKSLESRDMLRATLQEQQLWHVSQEGLQLIEHGSHEANVFALAKCHVDGLDQRTMEETLSSAVAKIGLGKALQQKWVELRGTKVVPIADAIVDRTREVLREIQKHPQQPHGVTEIELKELKKRKLIDSVTVKSYRLEKGPQFALVLKELATDMTTDMIMHDHWKHHIFKKYNFANAQGILPQGGHLHPLMKVREQFRQIFFEMGFTEMPTNRFIESSFWNFDALFQPQQHPARDLHDTFFIENPALATQFPMEYVKRVKQVHEMGGYGSMGYRYDWKMEEAQKNILRTHTTAISARMLYTLAQQQDGFHPVKYFSIDRVFRNENVDATHLAEFHQIEGVIADYHLTLGDLIGVLAEFFKKLGLTQLKFKPAYNPYTEPSMEIFSYHPGLKRWIEVGNSGIFRPEMLEPMGLPKEVVTIAWGLSLERPTMIKYGISNIRDLIGHKVDLQMIHTNPICRLDKNK